MSRGKKAKEAIRSRIIGHSEEKPEDLMANPLNFRRHPGSQLEALRGSMKELGWIKSVLVNKVTGHVIDGHARCEEAMRQGVKVPVDWVELTPEEERLALAVLDPITEMATRDDEVLAQLISEVQTEEAGLQALLDDLLLPEDEGGDGDGSGGGDLREREATNGAYTTKIATPVYEPKGEKPPVTSLWDAKKTHDLQAEIHAADIPEDEKAFLLNAAARHTVFDYRAIAEFYCHASPQVQKLMEDSALVIIDFHKAIENGYVKLTEEMMAIAQASKVSR